MRDSTVVSSDSMILNKSGVLLLCILLSHTCCAALHVDCVEHPMIDDLYLF